MANETKDLSSFSEFSKSLLDTLNEMQQAADTEIGEAHSFLRFGNGGGVALSIAVAAALLQFAGHLAPLVVPPLFTFSFGLLAEGRASRVRAEDALDRMDRVRDFVTAAINSAANFAVGKSSLEEFVSTVLTKFANLKTKGDSGGTYGSANVRRLYRRSYRCFAAGVAYGLIAMTIIAVVNIGRFFEYGVEAVRMLLERLAA